jgi:signal transduction histidine kinase
MALTPELLVPRIGDVLVEQALLTINDLNRALEIQKKEREKGKQALIGQVLVEHGFITQEVLTQAVTQQIFQLHDALRQANATLEQRVKDRTRELELAYEKLSELATLKANFISNISHELRTPLTHIKGYINLILEGDLEAFQADQQYALQVIQKATERLSRLIEDLILYSTSETSSLQVTSEEFDAVEVGKKVIEQNSNPAKTKQITLKLESLQEPVIVNSDKEKVFWVINQLVDNAIKYTAPGGNVTIRILSENNRIKVEISDSGLGIPPEKIEEIFEPFHQLDESTTRLQGGTGLGLSLARKIVEALDSSLSVTSSLGHGSTFSFLLKTVI